MHSRSSFSAFALGLALACTPVRADKPCDIYAAGGTPCYAAHSTVRALYDNYMGALYQIIRGSDGATYDIDTLPNGVAHISAQDSFCNGSTCLISIIYDQSGRGNHLTQAPPGGAAQGPESGGKDYLASAIGAPVYVDGSKAYGVFISPYTGYRNNNVNDSITGDAAEGMYAVFDGTHYNGNCCFDYGNAETNNQDPGNGHMEAIYFGNGGYKGSGDGPWVQADLENGLFSGASRGVNEDNKSIQARFVTAILKGKTNQWALRGGDATSGSLSTMYSGVRPSGGYNPMSKEGAIILGIGGDNSDRAQGTFYEGAMTTGYPSDDTENKVQANIVAATYGVAGPVSPNFKFAKGSAISLRATTSCCTNRYIAHTGSTVNTQVISSSSSASLRAQASWIVHTGLGNSLCYSFESKDTPGSYIRHSNYELYLDANDNSKQFGEDATFCPQTGINGADHFSMRSWSYPARYWRHYNAILYIAGNGGPNNFDATYAFNDDVSFAITSGLA
ncbi:Alpha-L-arabinofuranosidase [Talaromyces marneffei ATCC 18224]|uniref:Alpha-L-arabinofuranosidase n=2 Tax=Talaromyces marneffei TaxID=37727 RepID=B6QAF3_TALMQ|nr:uncharacterized protein EYB26_005967 [Talaromyces marneffei]EEA26249.1 alpha-N-arabinofuranosidase precursor, putative [Talaromyces marneffei ATCC 18224]KAE8554945.1 hypothetical protein EYB25_003492 [Talaromyces marneffei]QGA18283.1 hypothetical protein EYB26_005967 [Talaromyces marneffei]